MNEAFPLILFPLHLNSNQRIRNKSIVNLSKLILTTDESSLLELVIASCPTVKMSSKEQTTNYFHQFIRQLKLLEYFYENPKKALSENTNNTLRNSKCDPLNWKNNNLDWYPQDVKENRSNILNSFIEKVLFESNESMKKHKSMFVSDLTPKQRIASELLTKNKNIVIMPIRQR